MDGLAVIIQLDDPQMKLLATLVEASRRVPGAREFFAIEAMGADPRALLQHDGLREADRLAHLADIDLLHDAGLVKITHKSGPPATWTFYVRPAGFTQYSEHKRAAGESMERVVEQVRQLLTSEQFQHRYPGAYANWSAAESALWGAERPDELSIIGHRCREAIQSFMSVLVDAAALPDGERDPAKTVSRLRALLGATPRIAKTDGQFLLAYWGAVSDLIQRLEHAGQKEGRAVTWDDARLVVFQTMCVMYETDQILSALPSA